MTQEYCRANLRVSVAQICQQFGWNSIHSTPLELLTDVLERYLLQLGKVTHRYAEQFGRTDPRLEDLQLAFGHMGVQLLELEEYARHVDIVPFAKEVVAFPEPRPVDLKFPNPESKEVQQRKVFEFVPEHLPYMHPELNEENEDSNPAMPVSPERLQVEPQTAEMSPGQGEKRPLSSPGDPAIPFKRPRLTTSQNLPEEASHSQYEMKSVVMTNSGILSPLREGKLPDVKTPPTGVKQQIVIVKHKNANSQPMPGVKLNPDTPIITLDLSSEQGGKIVEIRKNVEKIKNRDPDFNPKKKKGKITKKLNIKEFKIKKSAGRPKTSGHAQVVHNKGAAGVSKIISQPRNEDGIASSGKTQDTAIDLSVKPTPPAPNISVKKEDSLKVKQEVVQKTVEFTQYRPKTTVISKQQIKDMEDTIASVIEQSSKEIDKRNLEYKEKERSMGVTVEKMSSHVEKPVVLQEPKPKEPEPETWRVSHISESYGSGKNDSFEDDRDSDSHGDEDRFPPHTAATDNAQSRPLYQAPHLALLQSSPRPRGRPRGSTSNIYKTFSVRSPHGRKPGRPPLNKSPGRPPYSGMTRSPGRPPLNRSPGRPPGSGRSPGRPPGSGRSPGRPKGVHNISPKVRGRPRGSKSPRGRGASPRGSSPRAILNINFDENTTNTFDSTKTKIDNDDSDATLFEFPTKSPDSDSPSLPGKEDTPPIKEEKRQVSPPPIKAFSALAEELTKDLPIARKDPPTRDVTPTERRSPLKDHRLPWERESSRDRDSDKRPQERDWTDYVKGNTDYKEGSRERDGHGHSRDRDLRESGLDREGKEHSREREIREWSRDRDTKEHSRDRDLKEPSRERERSKEHKKDKKKKKKKDKEKERERDKDKEKKEKHKIKEKEAREESPSVQPLQKLKIKFGGGPSSTVGSFSISTAAPAVSPKLEPASPPSRPEIPKLKLQIAPESNKAKAAPNTWVSTIKEEKVQSPVYEPQGFRKSSPANRSPLNSDDESDKEAEKTEIKKESAGDPDEEVTVSVIKGKVIKQKATKVKKRRGSAKKGRPKASALGKSELFADIVHSPSPPAALSNENASSPITIPAMKAPPPPPSPPAAKKSPPKSKQAIKEQRPYSPLFKEIIKPKPPPVSIPKPAKPPKTSPRRPSPKKSPKISPPSKKKATLFPNFPSNQSSYSKPFSAIDSQPPRTPSPTRVSSPSPSAPSSPMYSPASSPARDSPLHFTIPPTPAFPTRTTSPPPSPYSRQISTDDEKEPTPPIEKPMMLPPPSLPPMPPSSAMKKARTVVAETVGSFVNASGEKVWICPTCTMQDDGSPMIGCDICDDWYHWVCVGIDQAPDEEESWYCPKCKRPSTKSTKSKRGRKKKKP